MSKNLDQLWIGYLSNCKLLAVTKLFKYFLCINLGPGSALWENEKKSALAIKKKNLQAKLDERLSGEEKGWRSQETYVFDAADPPSGN